MPSIRYHCCICGKAVRSDSHTCPDASLAAIDGADTRAARDEIDPTRYTTEFWRGEGQRLADGFELMHMDGDFDESDHGEED